MDGGTMTDIDLSSYMLVKDKDGQLKYYKDGQFFSTEEMDALIKQSTEKQDSVVKKIDFKPVLTFTEKKKELTPRIVTPKAESETQSEIPRNNTLDAQRSADQKAIEATVKN